MIILIIQRVYISRYTKKKIKNKKSAFKYQISMEISLRDILIAE